MRTRSLSLLALLSFIVVLLPATISASPPEPHNTVYTDAALPQRLTPTGWESAALNLLSQPVAKPQAGPGAIITVTTFNPAIADDGQCSLIEAVVNANDDAATHADCPAGSGPDTIELAAGAYMLTVAYSSDNGGTGLPVVASALTINGHGAAITRSAAPLTPQFRILSVAAGGNLTLNDLTISNGSLPSGFVGGGVLSNGTLACNTCIVENNTALAAGGIYNYGGATLVLNNSILRHNLADGNVGGALYNRDSNATLNNSVVQENTSSGYGLGGGILSWASWTAATTTTLTVSHSLIISNTAAGDGSSGGGISNVAVSGQTALLLMTDSTVRGNQAQYGAGIGFSITDAPVPDSQGFIVRSTISDNHAVDASGVNADGGAIDVTSSTVTVVNSTISGNTVAPAGYSGGGGFWVGGYAGFPPGVVHLINSTVANNSAATEGGAVASWTESASASATITAVNTIVSGNSAPAGANCYDGVGGLTSPFVSAGYNMEDLNTCNFDQPSDHPNTNPLLGALADNGGPSATHALLDGSPAIDAGDNAICAAVPVSGVDQRGILRPQGFVCDIGAYEQQEPPNAVSLAGFEVRSAPAATGWLAPAVALLVVALWLGVQRSTRPWRRTQFPPWMLTRITRPAPHGSTNEKA